MLKADDFGGRANADLDRRRGWRLDVLLLWAGLVCVSCGKWILSFRGI
jgi:hypothetical protein